MNNILVGIIIILIILLGILKKVNVFSAFSDGVKSSLSVILNLFTYVFTFTYAINLFKSSGIIEDIVNYIFRNVNEKVILELIIRPFSSSSSLSTLVLLYEETGINSFESIFCTLLYSGVDAVFYVIGLYQTLLNLDKVYILKDSIIIYIVTIFLALIFTFVVKHFHFL